MTSNSTFAVSEAPNAASRAAYKRFNADLRKRQSAGTSVSQTSTITTKHISNTTAFDTLKRDTGFDVSNSSDIVQSDSFVRGSKDGHLSIREGAINTVTSLDTTRNVAAEDQPYTICSNYEVKIPFPPRPKILVTASNESAEHVQYPAPSSSDAATRKGDESTPRSALCIPNRTKDGRQCVTYLPADFYPWNGTHPEDILSESAIRAGMYDRLLPNEAQQQLQRETSSARNLLRPPLKNKYGLHALSSFIANVLERRQARSCVMSSVMLRPPPRVTLTDTKREAWLRDLADPARDIRKLSRSIPHGLKGKSLLEQCMSKKIPVLRAVWFAKCVGANEIRAFNRKGSGAAMSVDGEVKWVRDWTLQLQQFIESIITPCKREDWWKNINYVLRLSFQLFADQLLDQDSFLDWLLSSLEKSVPEMLPVWLLSAATFWRELVAQRKYGRRLALALIRHLSSFLSDGYHEVDSCASVLNLLRGQLEKLASSDSTCLILPGEWTKYQGLFTSNRLSKTSVVISPATLHNLKQRNKRLDISGTRDDFPSPTHGQSLLKYLDATNNWDDIHAYSQKCMELAGSAGSTVSLVLRWATTVNRPGRHRLYAAVRLIQHLHASDVKTDEYIIDFLSTVAKTEGYVLSTVTRILSELVYSGSFSFNKYLQWLIATGFMSHGAQVSELGRKSHHTILHGVSSRNLPEHVQNLKNIILMSSGFLDDEGIQNVNGCENIKKLIVAALEKAQVSDKSGLPPAVKSLPDSEMVELSLWLQVQTKAFTNLSCHCSAEECDHVEKLPLKLKTFHTFRGLFEDLNDYRGLALFVASIKTNDVPLLSAIADTLLYHHKVLSAIGTLTSTSQALIQQYQTTTDIQALQAPICTLLMSLIEIATSLLYDTTLAAKLRRDVQRCRANLAGVAWSPASDNPVDAQSNPVDEIDQLLASGNTMDEKTLTRVFSTVTSRLDQVSRGEEVQPSSVTRWFFVLKTLNEAAFEKNMAAWIAAELQICQPDRLLEYTRPLIGIGCVTFETFIGICCDPTSDYGLHDTIAANNLFPLLSLLFTPQPSNQSWQSQDSYNFGYLQARYLEQSRDKILQLLHQALEASTLDSESALLLRQLLFSVDVIQFLQASAVDAPESVAEIFDIRSYSTNSPASVIFKALLDMMSFSSGGNYLASCPAEVQISRILDSTDLLSAPFYQLQLLYLQAVATRPQQSSAPPQQCSSRIISAKLVAAIEVDSPIWPEMSDFLMESESILIRKCVQEKILSIVTNQLDSAQRPESAQQYQELLRRYLRTLKWMGSGCEDASDLDIAKLLLEVLLKIVLGIQKMSVMRGKGVFVLQQSVVHSIEAVLHLSVMNRSLFFRPNQALYLTEFIKLLCTLLLFESVKSIFPLWQFVLDVASVFVDGLSDETKSEVAESLAQLPLRVSCLVFLFGASPTTGIPPYLTVISKPRAVSQPSTSHTTLQPISSLAPAENESSATLKHKRDGTDLRQPLKLRHWELLPDLAEAKKRDIVDKTDTAKLSLALFGARQLQ